MKFTFVKTYYDLMNESPAIALRNAQVTINHSTQRLFAHASKSNGGN